MKELSIEEKAKRYDEAIKRVENINTGKSETIFMFTEGLFEYVFPEDKESEDEKIRKNIISWLKNIEGQTISIKEYKSALVWLEKQGNKDEEILILKDQIESLHAAIKAIKETHRIKLEKQGGNAYNEELSKLLHKVICKFINDPDIPYSDREKVSMKVLPYVELLEKQGEHVNFLNKIQVGDKVTRNQDGVLVNMSQLNRVAKKDEKQSEQKDVNIQINQSEYINDMGGNGCYLKNTSQKSADKVIEEEKPLLEKFKQAVYDCAWGKVTCKVEGETKEEYANRWAEQFLLIVRDWADDYIDFTIQQKLRNSYEKGKTDVIEKQGEQKPAWSEEDEERLSDAIFFVREYQIPTRDKRLLNAAKETEDWLRTLKERYTWKPSDEQMVALDDFIYAKYPNIKKHGAAVKSLYQDLKKLRE